VLKTLWPPCSKSWGFKELRDCRKDEVLSQDKFEIVSKCQDIADAFEDGKNVKDEIDSAVVRDCVQNETISNQGCRDGAVGPSAMPEASSVVGRPLASSRDVQ
jgi:hypothetical protein